MTRASTFCRPKEKKTWMAGSSPAMTAAVMPSLLRRRRPRPLRAAQALERLGHAEQAEIVEAAADNLHADRKTLFVITAIDGDGRVLCHIPWHGIADVLERLVGIVDRCGELGREVHDRRYRRDHVVKFVEQFCGGGADR